MGFDTNINAVIQQIKGYLFDVVSHIQSVISSLEASLATAQDDNQKNQINTLVSQLQEQLVLILNNTSSLTDSILGYQYLLDNAVFKDSSIETPVVAGTNVANTVPEVPAPTDNLNNDSTNATGVVENESPIKEIQIPMENPIKEEEKPVEVPANPLPEVPAKEEEKPVEASANPLPEVPVKEEEKPVEAPANGEKAAEVVPSGRVIIIGSSGADATKEPVKEEAKPVGAGVTPLPEPTLEEVKPVETGPTPLPEPTKEVNTEATPLPDSSIQEEVKPVETPANEEKTAEVAPSGRVIIIGSSGASAPTKEPAKEEAKPVETGPTPLPEPVKEEIKPLISIEEPKTDNDLANDVPVPSVEEKTEAPKPTEESSNGLTPFRIGDGSLEINQTPDTIIASLGEDVPSSGLTFLSNNAVPRVIVVTNGQLVKLQSSRQIQAEKLESNGEITKENLEEMMSSLPSLYEINPEEAEKLSEKISAKLQEIEKKS